MANKVLQSLSEADLDYLSAYFGHPPPTLYSRGLCVADVVLALLRGERIPAAERVAGVGVRRLPPDPRLDPAPYAVHRPRGGDDRRVLRVSRNPRLPTTGAFQRFKKFKPGLTIRQLLSRGVTRRDIRRATSGGHVRLSA